MLDVERIRKEPEAVRKALKDRHMKTDLLDDFLTLDTEWRKGTQEVDEERARLKQASEKRDIETAKTIKVKLKTLEADLMVLEAKRTEMLPRFPNIPSASVPVGKDESENVVLKTVGKISKGAKEDYLALSTRFGLIDTERASKVAGSRFGYILREAALLEFALVRYAFDVLVKEGFIPVVPPVMVKPSMMHGMGKTKFIADGDAFYLPAADLYLPGSSEHTIGPMHADEVFAEADLPRRYVGFSTCFRREAGSYGKDTKGILRVHQFDKVEMFSFTRPEDSAQEHEFLLGFQERLMGSLDLPYRVVEICTGDMGFGDVRQFDIETWLPGEEKYRETNSCSNVGDFQSRGLAIKFKRKSTGKNEYVHTLNGTAFAIGRTLIALIENGQTADGSIRIPDVLVPYVGVDTILPDRNGNKSR